MANMRKQIKQITFPFSRRIPPEQFLSIAIFSKHDCNTCSFFPKNTEYSLNINKKKLILLKIQCLILNQDSYNLYLFLYFEIKTFRGYPLVYRFKKLFLLQQFLVMYTKDYVVLPVKNGLNFSESISVKIQPFFYVA